MTYVRSNLLGGNNDPNDWNTTPSTVTTTTSYNTSTEAYEIDPDLAAGDTNTWMTPLWNGLSSAGEITH